MRYIKIFDKFDNIEKVSDDKDIVRTFMREHVIKNYSFNENGDVDILGDFEICHSNIPKLPFKFGRVSGSFTFDYNRLTTLEGCPEYVGGDFSIGNNLLTSLKGCPKYIGGSLSLNDNKLEEIDYFPEHVGSSIFLNSNLLRSLNNLPKEVKGSLDVDSNELDNIIGSPLKVMGTFNISFNKITSLKGAPLEVRSLKCASNNLVDFKYCPRVTKEIKFGFNTKLKTLKDIYTNSEEYFCNVINTDLPEEIKSLYDGSSLEGIKLFNYIIKNQNDYMIWNTDGTLNKKRLDILLKEVSYE